MGIKKEKIASLEVKIGDINYGNHMGNDKALLFFQDARIKFLRSLGFDEHRIGENIGIIISESHVYYYKEVFLYDVLEATVSIEDIKKSSLVMHYEMNRISDGFCVIKGSTKIYAFEYENRKVTAIPKMFLSAIEVSNHE